MDRGIWPVFDIEWFVKSGSTSRFRKHSGRESQALTARLGVIRDLSKEASAVVNACDYDLEGETIGSNIIQFACEGARTLRAKFSTLTDEEIREAFSRLSPSDPNLALAGRMRHLVDFLWGVNLSRVLSESARAEGKSFSNVTIGRVQGPALEFVVDREIDVMTHVPVPYWKIDCVLRKGNSRLQVHYAGGYIRSQSEANEVIKKLSSAESARVSSVAISSRKIPPRFPFNLADLQKEAFRTHKIRPSVTLSTAQKLYLKSLISYPRTGSQKLPNSIGYQKIFDRLSGGPYSNVVSSLKSMAGVRH